MVLQTNPRKWDFKSNPFPYEAEAFKKYGRENVQTLKMEIDKLKEELKNNDFGIGR